MNVKDGVLLQLEMHRDESISGAKIAQDLDVSRNAVWKAVKELQADGYHIQAVNNKGYCLTDDNQIFSAQSVMAKLQVKGLKLELYDCVESTNKLLKQKAENGAEEGTVIIARQQLNGRGHIGRTFFSPKDSGIYMSILLRPNLQIDASVRFTTYAAVIAAKTLEMFSKKPIDIKWVNDLFVDNRKICGIMSEVSADFESGKVNYVVIGLGINLYPPDGNFPKKLEKIAGTLFENNQREDKRSEIISLFLNSFFENLNQINDKEYYEEYKKRLFILGKEVNVLKDEKMKKAIVEGIDGDFHLHLLYSDGRRQVIASGDVHIIMDEQSADT